MNEFMVSYRESEDQRTANFIFRHESHTLGNALRYILMKDKRVTFCGYTIPHPLSPEMKMRLQTTTRAIDVMKQGLMNLQDMSRDILSTFDAELARFRSEEEETMQVDGAEDDQ